jgi:hypothetical protein
MGELQHGVYNDDWDDDLTYEEISVLHGFRENGDEDEADSDSDGSDLNDLEEDSDSESDFNYMESSDPESCASDIKVRFSYPELIFYATLCPRRLI